MKALSAIQLQVLRKIWLRKSTRKFYLNTSIIIL